MSQINESGTRTFVCLAAIAQYLRVKLSGADVVVATAADPMVGTLRDASFASGDKRAVNLRTKSGTQKMVASEAIAAGVEVYAAAAGQVASSGTVIEGYSIEAASAAGDVIEVMPADV